MACATSPSMTMAIGSRHLLDERARRGRAQRRAFFAALRESDERASHRHRQWHGRGAFGRGIGQARTRSLRRRRDRRRAAACLQSRAALGAAGRGGRLRRYRAQTGAMVARPRRHLALRRARERGRSDRARSEAVERHAAVVFQARLCDRLPADQARHPRNGLAGRAHLPRHRRRQHHRESGVCARRRHRRRSPRSRGRLWTRQGARPRHRPPSHGQADGAPARCARGADAQARGRSQGHRRAPRSRDCAHHRQRPRRGGRIAGRLHDTGGRGCRRGRHPSEHRAGAHGRAQGQSRHRRRRPSRDQRRRHPRHRRMRRASRLLLRAGGARLRAGPGAGAAARGRERDLSRQRARRQSESVRRQRLFGRRFPRRHHRRRGDRAQRSRHRRLQEAGCRRGPSHRRGAVRRYRGRSLVSRPHSRGIVDRAPARRPRVRARSRNPRGGVSMNAPSPHPPTVRTTCPYCGVGCGVLAQPDGFGGAAITGDPDHPANFGRICSKGSALGETLGLGERLLYPMLRQADGNLARVDWPVARDRVAEGFQRIVARHGCEAIAFYLSGQLLTEDYYVANKLMKGFIGSANVDTNSRLCMASSVAGHKRAFGADTVPGSYEDLEEADLLVLVGSNTAWCHPVLFQRMLRSKAERGARIVVIDPRRTVTAEEADLFLPIAPGADTALFCGLLVELAERGVIDGAYVDAYTSGFAEALARAREIAPDITATAHATGLDESAVAHFFDLFHASARVVTCYSQGVNQSAQGTDKVDAIINCHLATGRIGRPGMGPFSLTGQPNAMGGREVGGLANQLAAHMGFAPLEIERVRRFWNAPRMATHEGLKAVQMFEAIERGEIKALWVMATNPVVSLPRAGAMREALRRLEVFVVSENVLSNDTVDAGAQILFPAAAWGEKDGAVTNSERRISRQRSFLPPPGQAQPDWWIVCEVAKRMGFAAAFSYGSVADVFREHAALSAFENGGARDFDIGGLAHLSDDEYDALDPVLWPVRPDGAANEVRFFAEGGFFTPDRKACFIAPAPLQPQT